MAVLTLTHASKIWTLTKKQEAKIETAEMKFLRSVASYTRKDQIGNTVKPALNGPFIEHHLS
jgi:hypothetical protein